MGTCCSTEPINNMDVLHPDSYKKIPSFIPPIVGGRVIKVYDGDTITIVSKVPNLKNSELFKFSIRLGGIDAPEIRGKSTEEKEMAIEARDVLSERIFGREVVLKNVRIEKYGRLLCDVYLEGTNLNQWMVEQRYAVEYDGGTKNTPDSWRKYREHIG